MYILYNGRENNIQLGLAFLVSKYSFRGCLFCFVILCVSCSSIILYLFPFILVSFMVHSRSMNCADVMFSDSLQNDIVALKCSIQSELVDFACKNGQLYNRQPGCMHRRADKLKTIPSPIYRMDRMIKHKCMDKCKNIFKNYLTY